MWTIQQQQQKQIKYVSNQNNFKLQTKNEPLTHFLYVDNSKQQ